MRISDWSSDVCSSDLPEVMIDVNTTPLIDVMLVLLVMLIITIPIQTHAVKMDMPQATPPTADETQPPPVVELEIDFDGTIIWNGMVIPSRHALEVQLMQAANAPDQPELHNRTEERRVGTACVSTCKARR